MRRIPLRIPDHSAEEEANRRRQAEQQAKRVPLATIASGQVAEAIVKPLGRGHDDCEAARRQDIANDADQRPQ